MANMSRNKILWNK